MKSVWLKMFKDLRFNGKQFSPRGQRTLEIENYSFELNPIEDKFCSLVERKNSVKYLVAEFLWYLSGDRDNTMMENYSSMWKTVKNEQSPFYNSNYGYYLYKEGQFNYVIKTLLEDKDSRQACILINRKDVMMSDSKDKICTNSLTFRIRENKLNMSVSMRSNDLVFGTTIDVFQFGLIYEMIYLLLKEKYTDLEIGTYNHKADSFHIYERHFDMMDKVILNSDSLNITIPRISSANEVRFMLLKKGSIEITKEESEKYLFYNWCINALSK